MKPDSIHQTALFLGRVFWVAVGVAGHMVWAWATAGAPS